MFVWPTTVEAPDEAPPTMQMTTTMKTLLGRWFVLVPSPIVDAVADAADRPTTVERCC